MDHQRYIQVETYLNKQAWNPDNCTSNDFEPVLEGYTRERYLIEYEQCNGDDFSIEHSIYQRLNIGDYFCPKNRSYYIAGSFYDDSYDFITIEVKKCITSHVNPI